MNTELLNQFFRFVKEREAIRVKRATGAPWPWSRDELLNNYHFTNVRRSDDKGTKWIVAQGRKLSGPSLSRRARHELLLAVYAYRSLNRLETFQLFGLPTLKTHAQWLEQLSAARDEGMAVGSNRHITFFGRTRKGVALVAGELGATLASQLFSVQSHVEAMRILINARVYLGPFTANQIVSDLALLGFGQLRYDMPCVVSAGSRVALGLIAGTITFESIAREKKRANKLADEHRERNGGTTDKGSRKSYYMFGWFRRIHDFTDDPAENAMLARLVKDRRARALQLASVDVEHTLCEFSKYLTMQRDGVKGKRRFHMSLP